MARSRLSSQVKSKTWITIEQLLDDVHLYALLNRRKDWRVSLDNKISIFVTYSKYIEAKDWYFFGIPFSNLDMWLKYEHSFIVFVLGDQNETLTIPTRDLKTHILKENIRTADDEAYKLNIRRIVDDFVFLQLPEFNTAPFHNNLLSLRIGIWEDVETPIAKDIGEPSETPRIVQLTYRVLRDTKLSRMIKELHNYKCQICGHTIQLPNDRLYVETHHIKPLGTPHNGPDSAENILCVCPNHHVALDYGADKLDLSDISTTSEHTISEVYINYHNTEMFHG